MSLLSNICNKLNKDYLAEGDVAMKPVSEDPRIFTMMKAKEEGNTYMGFFHVCNPRLLLTALTTSSFKDRIALNEMLNKYLARVIEDTTIYNEKVTLCGKCFMKMPKPVVQKLAIISNAAKLTLR